MLTWIAIGLLAAVALIAVPAIVGALLPKEFSGRAHVTFPAPLEEVFEALSDFEKHPLSCSQARRVERLEVEGGLPAWREDLGPSALIVRTIESEPPRRLVREVEDTVVPMRARWTYELYRTEAGTEVAIHQAGAIERGTWHVPFFRFAMRVTGGASSGPRRHLDSIAKSLSTAVGTAAGPAR